MHLLEILTFHENLVSFLLFRYYEASVRRLLVDHLFHNPTTLQQKFLTFVHLLRPGSCAASKFR